MANPNCEKRKSQEPEPREYIYINIRSEQRLQWRGNEHTKLVKFGIFSTFLSRL